MTLGQHFGKPKKERCVLSKYKVTLKKEKVKAKRGALLLSRVTFLSLFCKITKNQLKKMLSVSVFRSAAAMSVRRTAALTAVTRRVYTTDKEETPKETKEEPKVQVELSEEVKKMLAEKDKKISELQVNIYKGKEREKVKRE